MSLEALDDPGEAVAEIADAVQSYVVEQIDPHKPFVWPLCPEHRLGLHPKVHDDHAVWWCKVGSHALARVGELASAT